MNATLKRLTPLASALAGIGFLTVAGPAAAAEYWLCAKPGAIALPGAASPVPIWGYVQDDDANLGNGCPALTATTWTAAAPALTVPDNEGLTVHLRNDLTEEPTSLIIAGQGIPDPTPVWDDGTSGSRTDFGQRVRSFTHEAVPNGGTADYVWLDVKPGTYLYHSGTHPQVQVQMGLYGAAVKNALDAAPPALAEAYAGVPYATDVTLLYSEIDPAQHAAIADGTFGTGSAPDTPCGDVGGAQLPMTSTLCYRPKYYLINGKPYEAGDPALADVPIGQDTLLRLLNAGLRSYVPTLLGTDMKLIAEDGNRYVYREGITFSPRDQYQYSTLLASFKTTDVMITPATEGSLPVYDRRLHLVNNTAQDGGMFGKLDVACLAGFCTDLYITKDDGVANVIPGDLVSYTVTVGNDGPTDVVGATVTDTLPADLTGASWTCATTTGTASCAAGPVTGDINDTVSLSASSSVTYTVTGTLSTTAAGSLDNIATVAAPDGLIDGNPGNNSATDIDTVLAAQAYFSTLRNINPTDVTGPADDSDIYAWYVDGSTNLYRRVFDATATGVPGYADVDAFVYNAADDVYVSFNNNGGVIIPGVNDPVQDEDIVHWDGTSWSLWFDGSDVGLDTTSGEDVDAFAFDGAALLVSTLGTSIVTGPGSTGVTGGAADEDLRRCEGTFGVDTSCNWSRYFDGSDVGLTDGSEDVDFAKLVGGNIHLSTFGSFTVTGGLTGTGNQVFSCNSPTTGAATACASFSNVLTFPAVGDTIDAIDLP